MLLPLQGEVSLLHISPRALPWADSSLPLQGVINYLELRNPSSRMYLRRIMRL